MFSWFSRCRVWVCHRSPWQRWLLLLASVSFVVVALGGAGRAWDRHLERQMIQTLETATGVAVQLQDLRINPLRGRIEVTGLLLSNPPDFSPQPLVELDRLSLTLHVPSLWGSGLHVSRITVHGLKVRVEQRLQGNNLAIVLNQLDQFKGSQGGSPTAKKTFKIDRLILSEVEMTVRLNVLGELGAEKTLTLTALILADLTQDTLASQLRTALLAEAQRQLPQLLTPSPSPQPSVPSPP
ncbi:DUF748 domain-containing protein [Prochlorothrix hollandica]|uniref:DUF748 domain-containing protein n=1 Tax=Prochlorothrix hollandica TaxID=1223 RepID=UPI003342276E